MGRNLQTKIKSFGGEKSIDGLSAGSDYPPVFGIRISIRQVSVPVKYPYPLSIHIRQSIHIRLGIRIRQSICIRPPKNAKNPYSSVRKNPGG